MQQGNEDEPSPTTTSFRFASGRLDCVGSSEVIISIIDIPPDADACWCSKGQPVLMSGESYGYG